MAIGIRRGVRAQIYAAAEFTVRDVCGAVGPGDLQIGNVSISSRIALWVPYIPGYIPWRNLARIKRH